MLQRLKRHEGLIVTIGSLAWFVVLTPWGRFADPDAFYHAHIARLMLDRGALLSFPWLDLTSLGRTFADHHYIFHLILGPAIAALDAVRVTNAELWGAQLMAPLLATLAAVSLWTVLRALDVKRAWVWTTLALLIPGLSFRLLLAKASPLAIGAFVVVLGAMALRRPATAFLGGALFALSHGGWVIAIAAAAAMLAGDVIARRYIQDEPWEIALRDSPWRALRALLTGIALGILLHPNRLEIIQFLWVQVFKAGLAPSAGVIQGREWLPASTGALFAELAPLVIAGLLGALGLIVSRTGIAPRLRLGVTTARLSGVGSDHDNRQPMPGRGLTGNDLSVGSVSDNRQASGCHSEAKPRGDNRIFDRMRLSVSLALPVALTFALTLKSRRFIEYLVPALALWIASLWQFVDARRLKAELAVARTDLSPLARRIIVPFLWIVGLALIIHHASLPWSSLRGEDSKPFDAYRNTFSAVSERARPGDRVFHSDWDEFPILFAADDRLRYISGLDPTFLHEASSTLSDQVRDLTIGRVTSTAWSVIVGRTQSRFVFVTTKRHPDFDAALRSDARFKELARDSDTATYEVARSP